MANAQSSLVLLSSCFSVRSTDALLYLMGERAAGTLFLHVLEGQLMVAMEKEKTSLLHAAGVEQKAWQSLVI